MKIPKTQEQENIEIISLIENSFSFEAADYNDAQLHCMKNIGRILCEIARQLVYINAAMR